MNIFKGVVQMWTHTYKTNKLLFWIGAVGTIASVGASLILNLTINDPHMWAVMILFTIGSVSLSITSYMMKDSWMILLMTWYTIINTIGMLNLMFGG